jgi:hypothetical protein
MSLMFIWITSWVGWGQFLWQTSASEADRDSIDDVACLTDSFLERLLIIHGDTVGTCWREAELSVVDHSVIEKHDRGAIVDKTVTAKGQNCSPHACRFGCSAVSEPGLKDSILSQVLTRGNQYSMIDDI